MTTNGTTVDETATMRAIQNINTTLKDMKNNQPGLRDQFAIAIASSFLSGSTSHIPLGSAIEMIGNDDIVAKMAKATYKLADAMLVERENK